METNIDWYKKLAKKLQRIKSGELDLDDYIKEVDAKIENGNEALDIANVGKRIFIVFAQQKDPLNEAREIVKVFTKESEAVIWIADNNPKKYYYEVHRVG